MRCKRRPSPNGWVALRPELQKLGRIRLVQRVLPQHLKCSLCGLLRIGDDAVDSLLPIHVGRMFVAAAEGALHGLKHGAEDPKSQQQHRQRAPVVLRGNAPHSAEPRQ